LIHFYKRSEVEIVVRLGAGISDGGVLA